MKHLFRKLSCLLVIGGVIACLGVLAALGPVQAQTQTCTLNPTPPANVPPAATGFDTGAHVIATYNYARQQENPPCNVSLSIDPKAYDAANPQQQVLLLINAERRDRGINEVKLDATLLSQIAYNHADEENRYNLVNVHQSPINPPNGWPPDRIFVNPVISSAGSGGNCDGEIVDTGSSSAAAIYLVMYQDAADNPPWGHRQTMLQVLCPPPYPPANWSGIGITSSATYGAFYVVDFLGTSSPYTPPTIADTQPPSMSPPTLVSLVGTSATATVQVTNVKDNSDGSTNGVRGVTGVVFYVGSVGQPGNFTTVSGTNQGGGNWRASFPVSEPPGVDLKTFTTMFLTTLHAVAVDGSGNYTDCAGNALACAGTITEFAANFSPRGITAGPDGNLWFTEAYGNKIGSITPTGGAFSEYSLPTANSSPFGITSGPDGNLWFTEQNGNKIGSIPCAGTPVTCGGANIIEYPLPPGSSHPNGIARGPDGNLWFTEGFISGGSKIGRITCAAGPPVTCGGVNAISEYPLSSAGSYPFDIASGPDNNLWFVELGVSNNIIGSINPWATPPAISEYPLPSGSSHPSGIASGPDGNLWFTEQGFNVDPSQPSATGSKIGRIPCAGTPVTCGGANITEYPLPNAMGYPTSITSGPDGNLWFVEQGGGKIGRITPTGGAFSEYPAIAAYITSGPDGNLWFTEYNTNKIGRITPR
jgi:streptogramin lyase